MAGTGDVKIYRPTRKLRKGGIYRFEVVGGSMQHEGIDEGDYVVVKASSKMPREGDTIVTKYVPVDEDISSKAYVIIGSTADDIDEVELLGPTVKVFHEDVSDRFYLLGWKRSIKGHQPILAKHIIPIGEVVAIQPMSRAWEEAGRV
jgi:hypothetical protein